MTSTQKLDALKRESRAALNRAFAVAGLPPKTPIVGKTRKLSPDDPRVLECKRQAGLRYGPHSLEWR
jgi:hypothetical protein